MDFTVQGKRHRHLIFATDDQVSYLFMAHMFLNYVVYYEFLLKRHWLLGYFGVLCTCTGLSGTVTDFQEHLVDVPECPDVQEQMVVFLNVWYPSVSLAVHVLFSFGSWLEPGVGVDLLGTVCPCLFMASDICC